MPKEMYENEEEEARKKAKKHKQPIEIRIAIERSPDVKGSKKAY